MRRRGAATGRARSRCPVAGDSHRRRLRAVPRQRPGSGSAAWQRGEPAALARPARRGEVEEEDEGDRSRAALLAPVAALAARRERSGEGGSGRERARKGDREREGADERERGRGRRSRSLGKGNPKVGIIFVSLDYEKKPYKVNKSAKNWKKLERTTGSRFGRESTPRDLGHRFEIRRRKKIGVTWRVVLVEELAIFLAFKCVSCVSECKQVCEICK